MPVTESHPQFDHNVRELPPLLGDKHAWNKGWKTNTTREYRWKIKLRGIEIWEKVARYTRAKMDKIGLRTTVVRAQNDRP